MKSVRMFIVGLLSGIMLATAASAFAASETVQATFEKFVLIVNGSAPQEIEPLTYKGTTYLPLRETANRLGYDVTYKADGKTITLIQQHPAETGGKDVGNVNAVTPAELTGWIDLNALARDYGVYVASGDDLTIGSITVKRPVAEPDRIETFQTEHGTIHVKIENGRFYVILEEMKNAGVIQ